jgi:hypothetical protein
MSGAKREWRPWQFAVAAMVLSAIGTDAGPIGQISTARAEPSSLRARLTAARKRIAHLEVELRRERRRRRQLERKLARATQKVQHLSAELAGFRELAAGKPIPDELPTRRPIRPRTSIAGVAQSLTRATQSPRKPGSVSRRSPATTGAIRQGERGGALRRARSTARHASSSRWDEVGQLMVDAKRRGARYASVRGPFIQRAGLRPRSKEPAANRPRLINGYPPGLYRALKKANFFQADGA